MAQMILDVFLSFLAIRATTAEDSELRQRLLASWCELHSVGIVYSLGAYSVCQRTKDDVIKEFAAKSLEGINLNIGVIQGGDFGYDCSSVVENGRVKFQDSYSQFLLTVLQEILHFKIKLISSASWGRYDRSNRTWKGLAGLLASNRIDLCGCHWVATEPLARIADHLFATLETTESFVYLPQNLPLMKDVFVEAFSRKLWVFFLLAISLLVVSFWFSTYMHSMVRPDHEPWRWDEVVLWAVAAVSQQSFSRHPRGSSCRTMFLIGYLITYLLYTGFAAGITSLLALQGHRSQLTLNDVADMKLRLILLRDEYYLDFYEKAESRFASLHIQTTEGKSLKEIFQKTREINVLGFGSTVTLLHYLSRKEDPEKREGFLIFPTANSIRRKSFLVRKSFPYKHIFDYWFLRLRETGLLDLGKKRYLKMEEATHFKVSKWFSAGLGNVFSAFAFLLAGWTLSVLILFGEILQKKKSRGDKKKDGNGVELLKVGPIPLQEMNEDHLNILRGPKIPVDIPKISLGQFIFARLKRHNPYDIIMFEADTGRLITPFEFLSLSVKVAEGLKESGLRPGDIVSIVGKAKIDVYATATGILFQGATVSPVDPNLPPDVFRLILKVTAPKFVFCDAEVADVVVEVLSQLGNPSTVILYNETSKAKSLYETFEQFIKPEVDLRKFRPVSSGDPAESVAFLVCSSGTMGVPKPVMITDKNLLYQASVWGTISSSNKILLCPAITFSYFFWISGVMLYLLVVSINFEMTIVQKLEAKHILRAIDEQKPVWGMFAPALVKNLTWQPDFKKYNVSSLMMMITGGTSLQKVVVDKVKELWGPSLSCRQSYGMTEISGTATTSSIEDDVFSVGRLVPGFDMKVVSMNDGTIMGPEEEGELYLKSPSVMKGYMGNEDATREVLKDGWYKTGDVGRYTRTGLIYVTGRVKDFIRFNHALISPSEIEEVILGIHGVADAGVVGIPVDEKNQLPTALVVKMSGCHVTQEDVIKRVCENLPEEKHLRGGVIFVDSIPRTRSGKMQRAELLSQAKDDKTKLRYIKLASMKKHHRVHMSQPNDYILKGPPVGPIPDCSFAEYLLPKTRALPQDQIIQVDCDTGAVQTVEEFLARSIRLSEGLKKIGLKENDVVALMCKNCFEASEIVFATWLSGAVIAPADVAMKVGEMKHVLQLTNPKYVFCDEEAISNVTAALNLLSMSSPVIFVGKPKNSLANMAYEDVPIDVDVANYKPYPVKSPSKQMVGILPSSGTSGLPKGVGITHTNLIYQDLSMQSVDVLNHNWTCLLVSHFYWITGILVLLRSLTVGMKRLLLRNPTPLSALKAIQQYKPKWSMMGPVFAMSVANNPDFDDFDVSSIKLLFIGGSPFTPSMGEKLMKKWNHAKFAQGYGTTEVSGMITVTNDDCDIYSIGKVVPGVEVKIIDQTTGKSLKSNSSGEIVVKSPGKMLCYVENEKATREAMDEDGWLHTGDVGYYDDSQQFYLVDRIKEFVKIMNKQVAPAEVENVVLSVPGVLEVGVTGVTRDGVVYELMALVVRSKNSNVTEEDIHARIASELSDYKKLTAGVYFVESLPRTGSGKLQKREVRETAQRLFLAQRK